MRRLPCLVVSSPDTGACISLGGEEPRDKDERATPPAPAGQDDDDDDL